MAQRLWECLVQSHEWQPARQRLHTWLSTYVGPGQPSCRASYGTRGAGAMVSSHVGCAYGACRTA